MLLVQVEFIVVEGKEQEFRESWIETTNYVYRHFGSLGSRLHKANTGEYIAHAQWPDLETYERNHVWGKEGLEMRDRMRGTLVSKKVRILSKLLVDTDLFKNKSYS